MSWIALYARQSALFLSETSGVQSQNPRSLYGKSPEFSVETPGIYKENPGDFSRKSPGF